MGVASKSSDLNHTEVQSDTDPSANPAQDIQVKAVERGIILLKSKIQKNLELIFKWKDANVLELRQHAEMELSQLLTLVNKLVHEGLESLPNQLDRYCSDVIR